MEAIPEDRREKDENDHGKHKIIQKLSDECRDIGPHRIRELAVGRSAEALADHKIQHIIDHRGKQKGDRAAKQDKPSSAKDAVKRAVIVCVGGNRAGDEEDHAGQKIDARGKHGDAVRCLRAEVLRDDIHTHKREPRDENTAVQRDPIELEKRLIGKQIHTDDAHDEKRDDRRGNGSHQDLHFCIFSVDIVFDSVHKEFPFYFDLSIRAITAHCRLCGNAFRSNSSGLRLIA